MSEIKGGGQHHKYKQFTTLKQEMVSKGITIESMEQLSGVCGTAIKRARRGFRIRVNLANCIEEVLYG